MNMERKPNPFVDFPLSRLFLLRVGIGFLAGFIIVIGGLFTVKALQKPVEYRVLADSVREYSDEQGKFGWRYGYFDMNIADGQFLEMDFVYGLWKANHDRFWTALFFSSETPNGLISTKESREHWVVRRWSGDYEGRVHISGRVGKFDGRGDGVTVRVDVNGVEVWSQRLGPFALGTNYSFYTDIRAGSNVDFIITPHRSDHADNTVFTALIKAVE